MNTIVGRRVKIIKPEDSLDAVGKVGVVVSTRAKDLKGTTLILVRIKGWDQGHHGGLGKPSSEYWYFFRPALRLLPRRKRAVR